MSLTVPLIVANLRSAPKSALLRNVDIAPRTALPFSDSMLDMCLRWVDLDAVPRIIVDLAFNVLWQNRPSIDLLATRALLVETHGVLHSIHPPAEELMRAAGRAATANLSHVCLPNIHGGHVLMRLRHIHTGSDPVALGLTYNDCATMRVPEFANLVQAFGLTKSEHDIVLLLMAGSVADKIAIKLHISIDTVRSHIYRSYQKMAVKSREELFSKLIAYRVQ